MKEARNDNVCFRASGLLAIHLTVPSCLKLLLFFSCPLQDGWTALCIAAQNGHDTVVKTLLQADAAVDHAEKVGVLK